MKGATSVCGVRKLFAHTLESRELEKDWYSPDHLLSTLFNSWTQPPRKEPPTLRVILSLFVNPLWTQLHTHTHKGVLHKYSRNFLI